MAKTGFDITTDELPMMTAAIEAAGTVIGALIQAGKYNEQDSERLGIAIAAIAANTFTALTPKQTYTTR